VVYRKELITYPAAKAPLGLGGIFFDRSREDGLHTVERSLILCEKQQLLEVEKPAFDKRNHRILVKGRIVWLTLRGRKRLKQ
jgi:hypothetical protein